MQLTNGPLSCSQPTPSRDGKQLFARCAKLRAELVRYDRQSQGFLPFLGGVSAHDLSYSLDGKWVVYVSYPDDSLWRMRANGEERLQLTYPPMNVYLPALSPDGMKVAFSMVENRPWHEAGIYTVSLAGGAPQKIVDYGLEPYWSPDGNSIVFSRYRRPLTSSQPMQDREIMIVDVKSGKISSVPQGQGKYGPLWTSQTTLVANWWDNSRITRYDFKTQTWSDLATGVYDCNSTDSVYVYCETVAAAATKVVRIRLSDGRLEPVADLKQLRQIDVLGKDIGLAPHGELLFARDASTQEIYALDIKWP